MAKVLKTSRKTSIAGIVGALGLAMVAFSKYIDADPTTTPDIRGLLDYLDVIGLGVAAFGHWLTGLFAKDDSATTVTVTETPAVDTSKIK